MNNAREVVPGVYATGVIDWDRKTFDEIMELPDGTSYNSYVIKGTEKVALIDTCEPKKEDEFFEHLLNATNRVDFIVSNHAEQDHSGLIPAVLEKFPEAVVVTNKIAKPILQDALHIPDDKFMIIKEGDELKLGEKTLTFIMTPWVHWPETMSTFLKEDAILFPCDFFGSHLATSNLFSEHPEELHDPAKRYYSEIMQPFATIIRKNITKVRKLNPQMIAPSHGPIHKYPEYIIDLYTSWSGKKVRNEVVVAYVSMHGSTAEMAKYLTKSLMDKGIAVREYNIAEKGVSSLVMDLVDAAAFVVCSPTFLTGMHPQMLSVINLVNALHPKTRILGYVGSEGWGGNIAEQFNGATANFKGGRLEPLLIKGKPKEEHFKQMDIYASDLVDKVHNLGKDLLDYLPKTHQDIHEHEDVSIVLCGEAGQGIQSVQHFLTEMLKAEGYYIWTTKEYESRIRGGSNSVEIRVSSKPVYGFLDRVDLFLPLDKHATQHVEPRFSDQTIILGEKDFAPTHHEFLEVPFNSLAKEIGNKIFANTLAVGTILGIFDVDIHHYYDALKKTFERKGEDIVNKNIEAAKKGYAIGKDLANTRLSSFKVPLNKSDEAKEQQLMTGAEIISLGAIAGGCNFISAYPMSPSTGVLVGLAKYKKEFGIVVEQVEDEISGINMAQGAWYAGARALANTSGGGFALMEEGISLAGMTETPVVVHIAQRPGPATGLPTRTAQEDLNLVLYSGHGEFCRAIFAPGTLKEGFEVTAHAFDVADKYQIPVFVLTDQYFMDTFYNVEEIDVDAVCVKNRIVKTTADYERYKLTKNGISPRGVPGFGDGVVCVDSDEHTESGHITESMEVRDLMTEKRFKRQTALRETALMPKVEGAVDYKVLVIGWGTTYGSLSEAVSELDRDDVCYLHFSQVYPINPILEEYLHKAQRIFVVENNATGQFGQLITREFGRKVEHVLKSNGMPFSVEELQGAFIDKIDNNNADSHYMITTIDSKTNMHGGMK